jgi:hypothetical protein
MAVNLDAIQCNHCVRACREQVNDVIGYACAARTGEIVFDLNDPMGETPAWLRRACKPADRRDMNPPRYPGCR